MDGSLCLIAIGIDRIKHDPANAVFADLKYAASDAQRFLSLIRSKCEVIDSELFTDSFESDRLPTRSNLIRELCKYSSGTKSALPLILYFAGHGISLDQSFILCPSDFLFDIAKHSGLSLQTINEIIGKRSGWTLMIFDCCRAEEGPNSGKSLPLKRATYAVSDQVSMLFGCSYDQYCWEVSTADTPFGGIFTKNLAEFVKNNQDEWLSIGNAFASAQENTSIQAANLSVPSQTPFSFGIDCSGLFLRNRGYLLSSP